MKINGYTLVEMLVVLAIGSLLLTGVGSAIAQMGLSLDRNKEYISISENRWSDERLISLLSQSIYQDEAGNALASSKDSIGLRFRSPQSSGSHGWINAKLQIEQLEDKQRLLLIPEKTSVFPASILADNMAQIEMSSIGINANTEPRDANDFKQITLSFTNQKQEIRELSIYPKINVQAACVFDQIAQSCRR